VADLLAFKQGFRAAANRLAKQGGVAPRILELVFRSQDPAYLASFPVDNLHTKFGPSELGPIALRHANAYFQGIRAARDLCADIRQNKGKLAALVGLTRADKRKGPPS
jgi:hypothetical protein